MRKTKSDTGRENTVSPTAPALTEADLAQASQTEPLPLEREAASIKSVKASWYKQLIVEDILDAQRGTLQGKPLAIVNVHGPTCPTASHIHVIWSLDSSVLRLSRIFLAMSDDPRYLEAQKRSQKRLEACSDLLALVLAPTASYDTKKDYRKQMHIDTYQLSLSLDIYKSLEQLQKTRVISQQDAARWKKWAQPGTLLEEAVQVAREVIKELSELEIRVIHPSSIEKPHWSGRHSSSNKLHPITQCEVETDTVPTRTDIEDLLGIDDYVVVYWEPSTKNWGEDYVDEDEDITVPSSSSTIRVTTPIMRRVGRTYGYAMRVALSDQIVETALEHVNRLAHSYAKSLSFLPKKQEEDMDASSQELPSPTMVWSQVCDEKQAFEDYQKRWKESIQAITAVEQLFIK